jgi:hypothetical protein
MRFTWCCTSLKMSWRRVEMARSCKWISRMSCKWWLKWVVILKCFFRPCSRWWWWIWWCSIRTCLEIRIWWILIICLSLTLIHSSTSNSSNSSLILMLFQSKIYSRIILLICLKINNNLFHNNHNHNLLYKIIN